MTDDLTPIKTPLAEAQPEVQLAVDIIYLLEINKIAVETALEAIQIVEKDLRRKLSDKK